MAIKAKATITLIRVNDADTIDIGGRNYVICTQMTGGSANGITLEIEGYDIHIYGTNTKTDAPYGISGAIWLQASDDFIEPGEVWTLSTTEQLPDGVYIQANTLNADTSQAISWVKLNGGSEYQRFVTVTIPDTTNGSTTTAFFGIMPYVTDVDVTFRLKLEKANRPSDWTPAPEDVQDGIDNSQTVADDALNSATDAIERVNSAELEIDSINATIQNLVIGQDGETLMTIDEDGVHFDFTTFQEQISEALTSAEVVENGLSETNSVVDDINHQVGELNELKSYITMGDDTGTPFIELGSKQGDFKVRITNTEMAFMQGTQKIAYITNKQLYIQSSVVTDELKIGDQQGYIWKRRSNGHMGLRYVTTN